VGGASALSACFLLLCIASPIPRACRTRPRVAHAPLALFWGEGRERSPSQNAVFFWPGRHRLEAPGGRHPPPPLCTVTVSAIRTHPSSYVCRIPYCTCAGCHPVLFHHYGTTNQRAPCICQWRRRGWAHPDITKPWTSAVLLRHRCAPLWWLTSLVFHHSPRNALIASQLRTRCIQSIREAGPSIPPLAWHRPFHFTT
jgi:hypothetical protein